MADTAPNNDQSYTFNAAGLHWSSSAWRVKFFFLDFFRHTRRFLCCNCYEQRIWLDKTYVLIFSSEGQRSRSPDVRRLVKMMHVNVYDSGQAHLPQRSAEQCTSGLSADVHNNSIMFNCPEAEDAVLKRKRKFLIKYAGLDNLICYVCQNFANPETAAISVV